MTVLNFLKNIFASVEAPLPLTPVEYPAAMAEMVEFLVLLQAQGTAPESGKKGNLLRLTTLLSQDSYSLGYLQGMLESVCHQWEVPENERRSLISSASSLIFRDLLDSCCDRRSAPAIEDAAFNGARLHANDEAFLRGKFDGCSEMNRYATTRERADMPGKLHLHLKQAVALA